MAQQVAFKLTDGRGFPLTDTLLICNERGEVVSEAMVEHEGMGSFVLPADFAGATRSLKRNRRTLRPTTLRQMAVGVPCHKVPLHCPRLLRPMHCIRNGRTRDCL